MQQTIRKKAQFSQAKKQLSGSHSSVKASNFYLNEENFVINKDRGVDFVIQKQLKQQQRAQIYQFNEKEDSETNDSEQGEEKNIINDGRKDPQLSGRQKQKSQSPYKTTKTVEIRKQLLQQQKEQMKRIIRSSSTQVGTNNNFKKYMLKMNQNQQFQQCQKRTLPLAQRSNTYIQPKKGESSNDPKKNNASSFSYKNNFSKTEQNNYSQDCYLELENKGRSKSILLYRSDLKKQTKENNKQIKLKWNIKISNFLKEKTHPIFQSPRVSNINQTNIDDIVKKYENGKEQISIQDYLDAKMKQNKKKKLLPYLPSNQNKQSKQKQTINKNQQNSNQKLKLRSQSAYSFQRQPNQQYLHYFNKNSNLLQKKGNNNNNVSFQKKQFKKIEDAKGLKNIRIAKNDVTALNNDEKSIKMLKKKQNLSTYSFINEERQNYIHQQINILMQEKNFNDLQQHQKELTKSLLRQSKLFQDEVDKSSKKPKEGGCGCPSLGEKLLSQSGKIKANLQELDQYNSVNKNEEKNGKGPSKLLDGSKISKTYKSFIKSIKPISHSLEQIQKLIEDMPNDVSEKNTHVQSTKQNVGLENGKSIDLKSFDFVYSEDKTLSKFNFQNAELVPSQDQKTKKPEAGQQISNENQILNTEKSKPFFLEANTMSKSLFEAEKKQLWRGKNMYNLSFWENFCTCRKLLIFLKQRRSKINKLLNLQSVSDKAKSEPFIKIEDQKSYQLKVGQNQEVGNKKVSSSFRMQEVIKKAIKGQIIREVSEGNAARIFEVFNPLTGRTMLIKRFRREDGLLDMATDNYEGEKQILTKLSQKMGDWFPLKFKFEDKLLAIKCSLVGGCSLETFQKRRIMENVEWSQGELAYLFQSQLQFIDKLHQNGFYHGNIKSANIFLVPQNQNKEGGNYQEDLLYRIENINYGNCVDDFRQIKGFSQANSGGFITDFGDANQRAMHEIASIGKMALEIMLESFRCHFFFVFNYVEQKNTFFSREFMENDEENLKECVAFLKKLNSIQQLFAEEFVDLIGISVLLKPPLSDFEEFKIRTKRVIQENCGVGENQRIEDKQGIGFKIHQEQSLQQLSSVDEIVDQLRIYAHILQSEEVQNEEFIKSSAISLLEYIQEIKKIKIGWENQGDRLAILENLLQIQKICHDYQGAEQTLLEMMSLQPNERDQSQNNNKKVMQRKKTWLKELNAIYQNIENQYNQK